MIPQVTNSQVDANELANQLCDALHVHDYTTGTHSRRVATLARQLGEWMGLDSRRVANLELACLLHDIGKLFVSLATINKPGLLNDAEWDEMKTHPELGYELLRDYEGFSSVADFDDIADIVRSHHERFDGTGYPRRVGGEQLLLESRICTVVDAYDAMTSERPYGVRLSHDEAVEELYRCAGSQFDPLVVQTFATMPIGMFH